MASLKCLESEEIALSALTHSMPAALVKTLARRDDVRSVRRALFSREIGEGEVRAWIAKLLGDFVRGQRFSHEGALCALTVCLAPIPGSFPEEVLNELACVGVSELTMASQVARVVLNERFARITRNLDSYHELGRPQPADGPIGGDPPRLNIGDTSDVCSLSAA